MKSLLPKFLLYISLCFLGACSAPDATASTPFPPNPDDPAPETDNIRFNALINCLGDNIDPQDLIDEPSFKVIDYFGELTSLGHSALGASQLANPWCLLTIDIKNHAPEEAFYSLRDYLHAAPTILLRALAPEAQVYGQDRGARSFDPDCEDLPGITLEANASHPIKINNIRSLLGVTNPNLQGQGITIAMFDGGTNHADTFMKTSNAASFSRNFLHIDYPLPSEKRYAITDDFDCEETKAFDGHGSLVTDIIKNIAPRADLIMFKVCNDNGFCPSSSVAKALLYISNHYAGFPGIDIINMSFGGNLQQDLVLRAIIERMTGVNHETLFVASLGNIADAPAHYPADYYDLHYGLIPVVAAKKVTSADDAWQLASFNNKALLGRSLENLLVAPGVRLELAADGNSSVTGTSFAAPIVSGIAALERQQRPQEASGAAGLHVSLLNRATTIDGFKFVQFRE